MSASRNNVCVFCQFTSPRKRLPRHIPHRFDTPFSSSTRTRDDRIADQTTNPTQVTNFEQLQRQLALYSHTDFFRATFLRKRPREIRSHYLGIRTQRERGKTNPLNESELRLTEQYLRQDIGDDAKRKKLFTSETTETIEAQLRACRDTGDLRRVVSTAFQSPEITHLFSSRSLQELFRERVEKVEEDDKQLGAQMKLITINLLLSHLRASDLRIQEPLIFGAIEYAALSHSLTAFRDHLFYWMDRRHVATNRHGVNIVRPPLASWLINAIFQGCLATSNIRTRAIEVILYGGNNTAIQRQSPLRATWSPDEVPKARNWMRVLSKCNMTEHLRRELEIWSMEKLKTGHRDSEHYNISLVDFIQAFFEAGHAEEAWRILRDEDKTDKDNICKVLVAAGPGFTQLIFDNIESMPQDLSHDVVSEIESKCTIALRWKMKEVEDQLGIKWITPTYGSDEGGYHVFTLGQRSTLALRKLAEEETVDEDLRDEQMQFKSSHRLRTAAD